MYKYQGCSRGDIYRGTGLFEQGWKESSKQSSQSLGSLHQWAESPQSCLKEWWFEAEEKNPLIISGKHHISTLLVTPWTDSTEGMPFHWRGHPCGCLLDHGHGEIWVPSFTTVSLVVTTKDGWLTRWLFIYGASIHQCRVGCFWSLGGWDTKDKRQSSPRWEMGCDFHLWGQST